MNDIPAGFLSREGDNGHSRKAKERMLGQRARVIWLGGLSGAGKTTLGLALEQRLLELGFLAQLIDGDIVRHGINSNLQFSLDDRIENIRRVSEVSSLFLKSGVITINCFITPTNAMRRLAREILGEDLLEVFIHAPLEVCENRDPKGLYRKARRGEIADFTGVGSPFEVPEHPDLTVHTHEQGVDECLRQLVDFILPRIRLE
ncbi:MAG TPA: adenylyl-sulfate kinase [Bacteroidales bacterium]|nr:adenylyl-sulfate kinase [Bacteroidales bacterium]HRZ77440.1 adenylyl-sulfate kinase [Bacteroidales bacterium]